MSKESRMKEFYIETNSFAAPFFSDRDFFYIKAETPQAALRECASKYKHPAGLYAAAAYSSADAKNKGAKPLAVWLSNHAKAMEEATKGKGSYSCHGLAPGVFEIDGKRVEVENPKGGSVQS